MYKILNLFLLMSFTSCSTIYYKSWEVLGKEKRDLLESNMGDLSEDQEDAREEFSSVLEKIQKKYYFDGGKLEDTYDKVSSDYEDLESEVNSVSDQIEKVEEIAEDLFDEWEDEADSFENASYRKRSLASLDKTKKSFKGVLVSARKSEEKMKRLLKKYRDQVLYIKHNLNAKAIGHLSGKLKNLENEMNALILELKSSIEKSKNFTTKA